MFTWQVRRIEKKLEQLYNDHEVDTVALSVFKNPDSISALTERMEKRMLEIEKLENKLKK